MQGLFRTLREINEDSGTALLLVEQNAELAMEIASRVYLLEVGAVRRAARSSSSATTTASARLPRLLGRRTFMDILLTRLFAGATAGSVYVLIALCLVIVFRSSSTINFAQGELALFTSYVSWWLTEHGWNIWLAVVPAVVLGFAMGAVAERWLIRPVRKRDETAVLIVGLALFTGLNGLDGWIWGSDDKVFPRMLPSTRSYFTIRGARLYYDSAWSSPSW